MAKFLGIAGGVGGDSTIAKKKVMTAAEGRIADMEAMSGKRKSKTRKA
jgi:hypothetical protein